MCQEDLVVASKIDLVELIVDRERLTDFSRTRAKLANVRYASAVLHQLDAFQRFDGSDQNGTHRPRLMGNDVEHPMDSVGSVDVDRPRLPFHHVLTALRPGGMGGAIGRTQI